MARKKNIDQEYDPAEVARLYLSGLSQAAVGRIVGLDQSSVCYVLKRHGIAARREGGPRRYALDEGYFETVDTAEKAYWLGFLAADGGIRPGNHAVMVHLGEKDADHLRNLSATLGSSSPVRPTATGVAVIFNSTRMVQSLAQHGIMRRKSYTCEPWDGPQHLLAHYWRGAMDGDGHISKTRPYVAYIGTHEMVDAFLSFAHGICGTEAKAQQRPGSGAAWTVLLTGAYKVPQLVRAMYEVDGPALERKKQAALALIARYPPRTPVTCRICGARQLAQELCGKHYQRLRTTGSTELEPRTRKACKICGDPAVGRGLCGKHYRQAIKAGEESH